MQWLAVQEVARKWGVTEQTIRHYYREGYIDGTVMNGRIWYIPPSAQPPVFDEWKALPPPLLQKLIIQRIRHIVVYTTTCKSTWPTPQVVLPAIA